MALAESQGITPLIGSIDLDADVEGRTLEIELKGWMEKFIRDQELRGYTLMKVPGVQNPDWARHPDGTLKAYFARQGIEARDLEGNLKATKREESLEESKGMVEYRCFGFFRSPERSMEMLVRESDIYAKERADRKPAIFGP